MSDAGGMEGLDVKVEQPKYFSILRELDLSQTLEHVGFQKPCKYIDPILPTNKKWIKHIALTVLYTFQKTIR